MSPNHPLRYREPGRKWLNYWHSHPKIRIRLAMLICMGLGPRRDPGISIASGS